MDDLKHIKATSREQKDDVIEIKTQSYYDALAFEQIELEKLIYTDRDRFFKDLMECVELVTTQNSPRVVIEIKSEDGLPRTITKKWLVSKKHFPRR
jgi:hypothetical protein